MPITYTGPTDVLAQVEQLWRSGLPGDVAEHDDDTCAAFAEAWLLVEGQCAEWARDSRIGTARGRYLDQHGRDQLVYRNTGEADDPYRERLRHPIDAVTHGAVLAALNALAAGFGATAPAYDVRVPVDCGCFVGDGTTTTWDGFVADAAATIQGDRVVSTVERHLVAVMPRVAAVADDVIREAALAVFRDKEAAGRRTFSAEVYTP